MATILLGNGIVAASGSVGGIVYSRNKSGAYIRAKGIPVNPNTPLQAAARADWAFITQLWRSGTSLAQKAAWSVFAANMPQNNRVGTTIKIAAFNQFVKANVVAKANGFLEVLDAPVVFTLPGEDPLFEATVDAGTGKISIVFDDAREWVDEDDAGMIISVGLPQDDSINFFGGPYRLAGAIAGDGVTPPTTPDATLDVPFEVADGQKIWVRGKIKRADGRVSDWFQFDSIVATA